MAEVKPVTTAKLKSMKQNGEKIAMLTAYDYPSAVLAEEAGIDVILVGDSLGNVVLGYESTVPVTLDDMVYHTRAVTRAVKRSLVVADMPFLTYHGSVETTLRNAARLMQEGLTHAVKLEGGAEIAEQVAALTAAGVPVMGHIGLQPQSIHQLGGYKVQGKNSDQAQKLLDDARALADAGAFAIVLELVTDEVSARITESLDIPTIGIGAGAGCDGQVLVFHDLLQYGSDIRPKRFVKTYADVGAVMRGAIGQYVQEVKEKQFPGPEHAFHAEKALAAVYGEKG